MAVKNTNYAVLSVLLPALFSSCSAIKCFECNSANNSACLEMHNPRMQAIVPVVDCGQSVPNAISKEFFCRKITQTILHIDKTPEVRVTRTCGWVKHKRECYKADNSDHLETVCQCFGDMCNAAAMLDYVKVTVLGALTAILVCYQNWRGKV
ncbi:uncharacterized protein LOC135078538 [Ostrinia nubilalis]|uniref:uncharacterized protein LOC135078538 n=1 Tax=Ostrinia nubilalis TaxID=29057 RepID=UPI00308249C0